MRTDLDLPVRTLVSAFVHDAVSCWLVPDPARRRPLYEAWFELTVAHAERTGAVVTTGSAVQVWFRGDGREPPKTLDDEGERRLHELLGPFADRFATFGELTGERHPLVAHWYLSLIGVPPHRQRAGAGTAALAASLRECDRAGLPTYLEASSTASRALYQRLGFADLGTPIELPGGPLLHPMWRAVAGR
ncbi:MULTISPECIES: GNAT family N-acetyltransferase [Saccharopolyspora]|uniref:GNAT family N-acetyltransferase n=1 Tax=Saccharopolyspora gregorii TaxID=33914 RepID=A0ABP6RT78_9PSEU|nr:MULTISPECIES: GNAT family N-acetyltransferase [Saccharopolyspora]MCA1282703.1 GNAT family N-acetyltransferase [Saccharopolyspora sp. 7B]